SAWQSDRDDMGDPLPVDPGRPRSPGAAWRGARGFRVVFRVPTPTLPAAPLISGDGASSGPVRDPPGKFAGVNARQSAVRNIAAIRPLITTCAPGSTHSRRTGGATSAAVPAG